jgi:hypothetical protein
MLNLVFRAIVNTSENQPKDFLNPKNNKSLTHLSQEENEMRDK